MATATKQASPPIPGAPLSAHQLRVLSLIAEGRTDQQIATTLHVGVDTAKKIVQRIYVKLQVNNRAAAVNRGWEKGILGPGPQQVCAPVAAGQDLAALAAHIQATGGPAERAALAAVFARLDAGRRAQQLLAKLRPTRLHAVPTAQAGA